MIAEDHTKMGAPEQVSANITLDLGDIASPVADSDGPSNGALPNGELFTFTGTGAVESPSPHSFDLPPSQSTTTSEIPPSSDSLGPVPAGPRIASHEHAA